MSRTMITNKENECIGYFGDSVNELSCLVEFMKDKKEISRKTIKKDGVNVIEIIVE